MDFSLEQSEVSLKEDVRGFAEQEIPHNWIVNFLDEESRDEDWAFSLCPYPASWRKRDGW